MQYLRRGLTTGRGGETFGQLPQKKKHESEKKKGGWELWKDGLGSDETH